MVNPPCTDVSDKDGLELKRKTNSCHLKPYVQLVVNPPCTDVLDKDGIELKTKTNSCHLKPYVQLVVNPPCTDVLDKDGIELKTKTNSCHLKPYVQHVVNHDNDEPIVGVVAFAKSRSIENIEAVLDITDTCTRPWAKDPKPLASLVSTRSSCFTA